MTSRSENGPTYTQQWTVENRLDTVTGNGHSAQYLYDGDGQRVKKVQDGQTTIYPSASLRAGSGAIYEKNVSTGVTTTYYFAGSMRIAMRQGGVLSYLAGDHPPSAPPSLWLGHGVGSTSLTLDASGNKIGEMKYYPYGETRPGYPSGSVPTDRRFTGQRQEDAAALGSLYDYGARMYSPLIGRFLSADTIVPDPNNPQQLNRFSYALNNSLKHIDPTGHMCLENEYANKAGPCDIEYYSAFSDSLIRQESFRYGVPWQIVAAILASEKTIDTGPEDTVQDFMYSHIPAFAYGFDRLRGEDNPGVGVGNVHVGTAWRVNEYFQANYGSVDHIQLGLDASDKPYLVAYELVDTSTNIKFVAAYTRMLSDYRFGSNGEPSHKAHLNLEEWTTTDVVAIWHAYRYGIRNLDGGPGFDTIEQFQDRTVSLNDLIFKVIGLAASQSALKSVPIANDYLSRQ